MFIILINNTIIYILFSYQRLNKQVTRKRFILDNLAKNEFCKSIFPETWKLKCSNYTNPGRFKIEIQNFIYLMCLKKNLNFPKKFNKYFKDETVLQ